MEISPILSTCLVVLALPSIDGGQFWHISDLHLDYKYTEGGDMSNFCHQRVENNNSTPSINSDIVGPAGNYHCDSPAALVESALLAMKRLNPNPDFIVWTGDSAPHWWNPVPSEDYILNVTKSVFTRLDKLFPSVAIIPALGNHDSSPPDQFPQYNPEDKVKPEYYMKLWRKGAYGDHINDTEARENFLKCGFYSKVVSPSNSSKKLKFIVLNTNMYYHDNFTKGKDPCGQLDWLNRTLDSVDIDKEKVFIVAHVPPGSFERQPGKPNFNSPEDHNTDINNKFVQIVSDPKYSNKISAHLYGHLHTDTFRVFMDRATRRDPVGVAFMAGSVTPVVWAHGEVVGVNPTIRSVEYSDEDATVMDYWEYSLDIIKAAKNESVSETETEKKKALLIDTASDSSQLPKSRRKNAKFLKQSENPEKSEKDNPEKTKRETLDSENPAADASTPNSKTTTTQPANTPTSSTTVQAVVGEVVPAVPTSANTAKTGVEDADIKVTEVPTIAEVDNKANNTGTLTPEKIEKANNDSQDNATTSENNVNNGTSTDGPNDNDIANNTNTADTTVTTENSASIIPEPTPDPDYPTYLSTQWTLLYQASKSYSVKDLSATSMFSALGMMVAGGNKSKIFMDYYKYNTGGHIVEKCNETCWREQLCTISNLVMKELATCLNGTGKDGFYEVHKTSTSTLTTQPAPTTSKKKLFGEGDDDPDHEDHGEIDHSDDHNDDSKADHDHIDHAETEKDVSREKLEDTTSDISSKAVAIFFGVFAVAIVALAAAMGYKKYRDNRYRNQEFLLTDAVFRYDGYSQLDDA